MKIIVDISHPAHIHFFKFPIQIWQQKGHNVLIVTRDKDITLALLDEYKYDYKCLSKAQKGLLGLSLELVEHESRLFRIAKEFKPDVMVNIGGTFIVHVGRLLGIKTFVFSDTEHARLSNTITYPFASKICVPDCYKDTLGKKEVRYPGYHELAYLHPNRFSPDKTVLDELDIAANDPFFVIRFVSWGAAHDVGHLGFSLEGKYRLVQRLSEFGRVIITSETPLPNTLEPFRLSVSPTKIHDLLYYSFLYIGEGGTMASEAAVLGTPSIFVSSLTMGSLEELQHKYDMLLITDDENFAIEQALVWAGSQNIKHKWQIKRSRMLEDKIDVTAWMVDFVERFCRARH